MVRLMSDDNRETKVITYNLHERERELTGKDRGDIDVKKIVDSINSKIMQEHVAHGDVFGYYGHEVRQVSNMKPPDTVVTQAGVVALQPAFVTTYIQAFKNGDIKHKARFLNNEMGNLAYQMNNDRVGGFSSAIDKNYNFHGFDYVKSPNYHRNRGWLYDSIDTNEGDIAYLDSILADGYKELYEQSQKRFKKLLIENTELYSAIAQNKPVNTEQEKSIFDNTHAEKIIKTIIEFRDTDKYPLQKAIDLTKNGGIARRYPANFLKGG